jgi:hypothetical protein
MLPDNNQAFSIEGMNWSAVPPLGLHGVGTAMVESLPSYLMRLMWTTGITSTYLVEQLCLRKCRSLACLGSILSTKEPELTLSALEKLEGLTGRSDLRLATFWAMSHILSPSSGRIYRDGCRRWCPKCYEDWDSNSYEPLIWGVDLLACCPVHGCSFEHQCSGCGAVQKNVVDLNRRRQCHACGAYLAKGARWKARKPFMQWVDEQVLYLAKFCATPRTQPVPYATYLEFVSGLRVALRGTRSKSLRLLIQFYERGARFRSQKISLRSLINLCALQGVSIRELLGAPLEASRVLSFEGWAGMDYLPIPTARQAQKIYAAKKCLLDFLESGLPTYLPPMGLLLGGFGVQLLAVRDVATEAYDAYQAAYFRQARFRELKQMRRAFICAAKVVAQARGNDSDNVFKIVDKVEDLTGAEPPVALRAALSALAVAEVRDKSKVRAYEAEMTLREAVDWFIESRRFV